LNRDELAGQKRHHPLSHVEGTRTPWPPANGKSCRRT
jgi:hypothetical protein